MMREQLLKMVLDLYLQMDVLLSKNSIFFKYRQVFSLIIALLWLYFLPIQHIL